MQNSIYLMLMEDERKNAVLQPSAVFGSLNTLISKECSEIRVLGRSSNHIFRNQSLRVCWSFFSKYSKFYVHFGNPIKLRENLYGFEDNFIWTSCRSYCQLWQEYMWLGVNFLKSHPKFSYLTKRHDTQLNFFDINRTLEQKRCRADFTSVFDALTCWFPKGVLKQEL